MELLEDTPHLCYHHCSLALNCYDGPVESENCYHDERNIEMNSFEKKKRKSEKTTMFFCYFHFLLFYEYFCYFFYLLHHYFLTLSCSSLIFLFWKYQVVIVMEYQELSRTCHHSEMMGQQNQLNQTVTTSSFDQYLPSMQMISILGE